MRLGVIRTGGRLSIRPDAGAIEQVQQMLRLGGPGPIADLVWVSKAATLLSEH
jgi:hypothetical protein